MSNIETFQPLLELSAAISECNKELQGKLGWKRKSKLKKVVQNMDQELSEQSKELINKTVDSWDSDQSLSAFLTFRVIKLFSAAVILGSFASGCTSVTVKPLAASYNVRRICIRENPKVIIEDFVPVIADGLRRHSIESEFIASTMDKARLQNKDIGKPDQYYMELTPVPDACDFNLTYTARRSWDLGTYLSTADISISDKKSVIANANYHLIGKGGLSLFKWQGVKTKIDPVMDELLIFYKK